MRAAVSVLGALVALSVPSVASADDAQLGSLVEVLEESVVTGASRSAERASDTPAVSSTITAEDLRRYGIRRLDEAINLLSLGMFSHDRLATPELGARGVALTKDENSHVLVVLDGMIVNEQSAGSVSPYDLPIDVVDRIEIILGPGSILYGSQAMFGVINIVTKAARAYDGYHAVTSLGASPAIGSSGQVSGIGLDSMGHDHRFSIGVGREGKLFGAPFEITANVEYNDFKGPRLDFPLQPPISIPNFSRGPHGNPDAWGGPVREQWYRRNLGAFAKLKVGKVTSTSRAVTTRSALPQMDLFENRQPSTYDDAHNANGSLLVLSDLRYDTHLTEKLHGFGRAYFGYRENLRTRYSLDHDAPVPGVPLGVIDPEQCPLGPLGPCRREASVFSRWFGVEVQGTYDWRGDGAYTTMVGVDGRYRTSAYEFVTFDAESGKSFGSDPAFTRWHGGGYAKKDEPLVAAYVQQVARPLAFLTINGGLRADFDQRLASATPLDVLSPRVAVIGRASRNVSVKLVWSTAFRAPSFTELYVVNGRLLPNPDGLRPERVSSYEAMVDSRFGAHTIGAGLFYSEWSNLIELQIVRANAPVSSQYQNVPGIRNGGLTLTYEAALLERRLRVGVNATIASARRELTPEQRERDRAFGYDAYVPVTVAPAIYGNARVSYALGESLPVLALASSMMGPRVADQGFYGGDVSNLSPRPRAPTQVTLRAALTGDVPRLSTVGYTLAADYAFSGVQPYVVGPNQGRPLYLDSTPVPADLAFVNRLTVWGGLDFHLGEVSP